MKRHRTISITLPVLLGLSSLVMLFTTSPLHLADSAMGWGDSIQSAMYLAWGHEVLLNRPWNDFFMFPISHPLPGGGGLTDMLPGLSVQTVWMRFFTSNPILIYNLTVLFCGWFNALAVYALLRDLRIGIPGAFMGGLAYAFNGYMLWHAQGHLSVIAVYWTPLLFLLTRRYLLLGSLRYLGLAGFTLFAQGATSSRLGLIACIGIFVFAITYSLVSKARLIWRRTGCLILLFILASLAITELYQPTKIIREHLPTSRSVDDVIFGSVDLMGVLLPDRSRPHQQTLTGHFFSRLGYPQPHRDESIAYIGILTILFLLAYPWLGKGTPSPLVFGKSERLAWIATGLTGFIIALGPILWINGVRTGISLPWQWAVQAIPELVTFRAVGRFIGLTLLGLSVFLGWAITVHLNRTKWPRQWFAGYVVVFLIDGFLIKPFPPDHKIFDDFHKHLVSNTNDYALVHLPYPAPQTRIVATIPVMRPMLNTIKGGLHNPLAGHIEQQLATFPDQHSLNFLRDWGVAWLVLHDENLERQALEHPEIRYIGDRLYKLEGVETTATEARRKGLNFSPSMPFTPDWPSELDAPDHRAWQTIVFSEQNIELHDIKRLRNHNGNLKVRVTGRNPTIRILLKDPINILEADSLAVRIHYIKSVPHVVLFQGQWTGPYGDGSFQAYLNPKRGWQTFRLIIDEAEWAKAIVVNELILRPSWHGFAGDEIELDRLVFNHYAE